MQPKRRINIKDVAQHAGVHPSTVSRVMNPETRDMVSVEVADKVMAIAEQIGYHRNPMASGLRTQRTHTVGILIPNLSNPIFPPIVRGIERTLIAEGYVSIIADSDEDMTTERNILERMSERHVDGLILATAHRKDALVNECIEREIPVVLVNRTVENVLVPAVVNNDEIGIRLAVNHLQQLGHSKIAYVGGPQSTSTGYDRYRAFSQLYQNKGNKLDRSLVVHATAFTELAGYQALMDILNTRKKFTAVVTGNDLLALGCYDALEEKGLRCPDDVSVTGFNDMPFINRFNPPLTTLHIPHFDLGVHAANLLLDRFREPEKAVMTVKLEPRLIIRGSTATVSERKSK